MSTNIEDVQAIENFLLDIHCLDEITKRLTPFNVFETLGIINNEIRHSNTLAWLLNPHENHNLSDSYLAYFLQQIIQDHREQLKDLNLSLINTVLMDYQDFQVRREWRNIDILIVSEKNKLVIIIENKIRSGESSHQLEKYHAIVEHEFSNYEKIYTFLTPDGKEASLSVWLSIDYQFVLNTLQTVVSRKKDNLSLPVHSFIEQYIDTIRRYIVEDQELISVCREIYYRHQRALDLIFSNIPDEHSEINTTLIEIINSNSQLILDSNNKRYVRFTTTTLDNLVPKLGRGWTASSRIPLFEVQNMNDQLSIKLIVGPGDQTIRQHLYDIVLSEPTLFVGRVSKLFPDYTQIYAKQILPKRYNENYDIETVKNLIRNKFNKILREDIKNIEDYFITNYNL